MKASGSTTIWREWAFISGMMDASTRDSIKMIRSTVSAYTRGLINAAMRATGTRENSMVLGNMSFPKTKRSSMAYGRMENVSNGSVSISNNK